MKIDTSAGSKASNPRKYEAEQEAPMGKSAWTPPVKCPECGSLSDLLEAQTEPVGRDAKRLIGWRCKVCGEEIKEDENGEEG